MKKIICSMLCLVLILSLGGCRRIRGGLSSAEVLTSNGADIFFTAPSEDKPGTSSSNTASVTSPSDKTPSGSGNQNVSSSSVAQAQPQPSASNTSSATENLPEDTPPPYTPTGSGVYLTYQHLTADQQSVYNIIKQAVAEMKEGMVPLGKYDTRDVAVAFGAVRIDYPEFFWLPNSYVTQTRGSEISIAFQSSEHNVSYKCSRSQRDTMQARMNARLAEIKDAVAGARTAYDIELALHDWLCNNVNYDGKAQPAALSYTAYGALVDGLAVCEGYSRAMQWLCKQYLIPCTLVSGEAGGIGHMWNMIYIENEWYHLDVTWDDHTEKNGVILHGYFNLNSARLKRSHKTDKHFSQLSDEELFVAGEGYNIIDTNCSSERYFYGKVNGNILNDNFTASRNTIISKLTETANSGRSMCEFYIDSDDRSNIETKYSLQNCFYDVKLNNGKIITGYSLVLTGSATSMGIILKFEGE